MTPSLLALAALLALSFLLWKRFFSPAARESRLKAAEASAGLRDLLLSRRIFTEEGADSASQNCIAADVSLGGTTFVTVAAFSDGTVSLYRSSGGGVLGTGSKPEVAEVAKQFRSAALAVLSEFKPIDTWPTPERGSVVYYHITPQETLALPPRQFKMSNESDQRHAELARWTMGLVNFVSGIHVVPPPSKVEA